MDFNCRPPILCKRIKNVYFPDEDWFECYQGVSGKFSSLRKNMVIFYPGLDEKNILSKVLNMSDFDLKELIDFKEERST